MIIYKCDLCKKQVGKIETLILYSRSIDYCDNCKTIATKIKKAMQNSIAFYEKEKDKQLKEAEINILRRHLKNGF